MITATVYPRKTLSNYLGGKKSWGIRLTTSNNKTIGHQYNSPANAIDTIKAVFADPGEEVALRVVDAKGTVLERHQIR